VIYERLGVPTVATVSWTIDRVMRKLDAAEAEAAWVDPTAAVSLVERFVPRHWAGRPIAAMERDLNVRAVSLARLGTTTIADPDRSLQEGDIVWVALATESIESFDAALNAVPEAGGHH
jgi:trk system potassium uptake protein TrkA